jgi:hypothetical protein
MREVQFHFQVELRCGVRIRGDFDGQGGGAFEVLVRIGARQLRGSDEARVRLQVRVGRQLESSRNIELAELMLVDVGPESVAQVVPNVGAENVGRLRHDMLASNELVDRSVIFVLLELSKVSNVRVAISATAEEAIPTYRLDDRCSES